MAEKQNFSMFRGEDKILQVTLDPVVNISTWTLAFTVRQTAGSAAALISKSSGAGIVITDGLNAVFQVTIEDTDTIALTPGKYAYDAKRTDPGAEDIIVYGTLTLLAEVTR